MQKIKITIRPVRLEDAVPVRENCLSMNTLEQVQSQIARNLKAYAERRKLQLVAEVDGIVIGIASLERKSHPLAAHRADIAGLVVNPMYQRQGIARRLVNECCHRAIDMGIEILEIRCRAGEPAEQVYRHLGFIEYGRLPHGLIESWGERKVFDEVYFYQPLEHNK